jgi:aryl-alcohol dehydrogenase-like predicted oxidoreductase
MRPDRAILRPESPLLGIGTAALALPYGVPGGERLAPDPAAARRTLLAAVERGVRFIDTAPAYGDAETLVGAALGDSPECMVATKIAIPPSGWEELSPGEIRVHVRTSAEASLRTLRRERIDLLQVHNADEALVRRGAVGEALAELRDAGLVEMTGATVYREADALAVVESPDFESVQVPFSALDRRPERRVLPAAAASGTSVIARSLLLRGVLSPAGRGLSGPFAALGAAADAVRRALGASWEELPGAAVAFVLSRPGITRALLGPRDEAELIALLDQAERFADAAAQLELPAPDLPDWLLDPSRWPQEATSAA